MESQEAARILVVDDERVIREILAEFLSLEGFAVHTVEDGEKALTELRLRPYDLLITDLKMQRLSGLQLLERIEAERLGVLTVLMTGFGTVETAIEAMKKGAYDYLLKPFKVEEVIHVVERALDDVDHLLDLERLEQVVVRALLHRLDRGLHRAEAGHEDGQHAEALLLDLLEQL